MDQFIIIAASIFMLLQVFVDAGSERRTTRRIPGRRRGGGGGGGGRRRGGGGRRRDGGGRRRDGGGRRGGGGGGRRNRGGGRRSGGGGRRGGGGGRRSGGGGRRSGGGGGGGHRQRINITGNGNTASNTIRGCRGRREITEKVRCDFNIHDLNHDGVIPYDEFIKATPYLNQFDKPELFNIFDNIDGDGLITPKEFRLGAQILTNMNLMDQCNFQAIADGPCFYS